jgi:hypothetical protein
MTYLLTHFWPAGTDDQYRTTLAAVHPQDGLPDGQISHAAGPTEGGYLISVLWDSKESADKFLGETLIPAMPIDGGFEGRPDERGAEVANLETR